jgi:uncharacterized OB-fold protein
MNPEILDWTEGTEGIAMQHCSDCHHAWYFRRDFCPACGSRTITRKQASGLGTVHAVTLVARAPSEALRPYAPYAIALVDADEGFRLMAHVVPEARIGDRVRATFHEFGTATVPLFVLEG